VVAFAYIRVTYPDRAIDRLWTGKYYLSFFVYPFLAEYEAIITQSKP
jgi:hypothetical protein